MRGYRKRPGTQGFSVPLVGASLFFIISLFLFASYKNSAYQQAKKEIYSLYTANRAFDLDEVYQDGLTAIYAKEYGMRYIPITPKVGWSRRGFRMSFYYRSFPHRWNACM